jgi:hypothetical protein
MDAPSVSATPPPLVTTAAQTRLYGRWLLLARVVWVVLAFVALGLFVAVLPTFFDGLRTPA